MGGRLGGKRAFVTDARQGIGRLGTVDEMATTAIYRASDGAASMTGPILVLDSAQTL